MKNYQSLIIFMFILVCPLFAYSATIHVYDGESIQIAINSSTNGDTVLVHDGEYYADDGDNSRIFFKGKAITLKSENGPDFTFICSTELKIDEGETGTSKVEGFTFQLREGLHWEHGIRCDNSSPTIYNCTFLDNISGIGCFDEATPSISECRFIGNGHYDWIGGGITCMSSAPTVDNCYFYGNLAGEGGAIFCDGEEATPVVTNCMFARNGSRDLANYYITWNGGAVNVENGGHPYFSNCTFFDNFAEAGSSICLFGSSEITLENCIIAYGTSTGGTDAVRCAAFSTASASLVCCDIYGNDGGDWTGCIADQASINDNCSLDPLFCDTAGSDFNLTETSPCSPDNSTCGTLIGSQEVGCGGYNGPYWHVSVSGDDLTGDGSVDHPFATIQHAIDVSSSGDHVLVHDGTFSGAGNRNIDFKGKQITVESENGPELTIVDCDVYRGFEFDRGEDSTSRVEGLTIQDASEEAFWCDGSSPAIINCIITECIRGVVCRDSANPVIRNCSFFNNECPDGYIGGGIGSGAAIYCTKSPVSLWGPMPYIDSCVFKQNKASIGAAISCVWASPTFVNCLFLDNGYPDFTTTGGAVFISSDASPDFTNCTFYGNIGSTGSVIGVQLTGAATLDKCILAYNKVSFSTGRVIYCQDAGYVDLNCCNVFGNSSGDYDGCILGQDGIDGNFSAEPIFCDTTIDDFHIRGHSPCVPNHPLNSCDDFIGAYTIGCEGPCWIVATYGDDLTGDGSYVSPYATIQHGIDQCPVGDTVIVNKGTYTGIGNRYIDMLGKSIVITSEYGADSVTVDLENYARGFEMDENEDANCVIDGLTIRGASDAAIYCTGATPTITDCMFTFNSKAIDLWEESSAHIRRCSFIDNIDLAGDATGVLCHFSSPQVDSCYFEGNRTSSGGAFYTSGNTSIPTISFCQFIRNGLPLFQTSHGAALEAFYNSHPHLVNCTFYGNMSVHGPAIHTQDATVTIENSIIAFNEDNAYPGGGPVDCHVYGDNVDLSCCILFGNSGGDFTDCIADEENNDGNFSANPLFCDTANGDFQLANNSLCLPGNNSCDALIGSRESACDNMSNTPVGQDIVINPGEGVTVTYDEVSGVGNTDVIVQTGGPDIPESLAPIPTDPTTYFNISTTATYSGDIEVCIVYDDADVTGEESELTLQHYDGVNWVNITSSIDVIDNIICGICTSLSPFIVAEDESTGIEDDENNLPLEFSISQNYPNPFNPITKIDYALPVKAMVKVEVFNILGQKVITLVSGEKPAGFHSVIWNSTDDNGGDVASGIYFYSINANDYYKAKKMIILK